MNLTTDSMRGGLAARPMLIGNTVATALALAALTLAGCGDDRAGDDVGELERDRPAATSAPADTGSISGRVTLAGTAPELAPFAITANADVCGTASRSNLLVASADGGIAGAVVYIEPAAGAPRDSLKPAAPQSMDQKGCQYSPHVVAATAGSTLRFTNSDPAPHNIRVEDLESGRVLFNIAQPTQGRVDEWQIPEAGTYFVGCDYHPWMNAYIVAPPSGYYAVTASDGSYSINGVPVGEHTVTVWHNSLEAREKKDQSGRMIGYRFEPPVKMTATVAVTKNRTTTHDAAFTFGAPTTASVKP